MMIRNGQITVHVWWIRLNTISNVSTWTNHVQRTVQASVARAGL
jgi:hypothetical protein